MGLSGAFQLLTEAIEVDSARDLEIISKTLSYLGISNLPSNSSKSHRPLFSISIDDGGSDCAEQVYFDPILKRWSLVPLHHAGSTSDLVPKATPAVSDWTTLLPSTSHVEFLKSRNWAATSLGPMSSWPSPLKLMTMKMLSDPRPANLYVGPDRVAVYNEPFSVIAASRHPFMMGATCEAALPATWPLLSQVFENIERTGDAFSVGAFEMTVEKVAGFSEE